MIDVLYYILFGWMLLGGWIYGLYVMRQTNISLKRYKYGSPETAKLRISQYKPIYIIVFGPIVWFFYIIEILVFKYYKENPK